MVPRSRVARATDSGRVVRRDPVLRQADAAPGLRGRHRRSGCVVRARVRHPRPVDPARARRRGFARRRFGAGRARPQHRPARRCGRRGRGHAGRAPPHVVGELGCETRRGRADRRARLHRDVHRDARIAARARVLDRVHARRPALHALLRRAEPVHRVDAAAGRRRQHAPAPRGLGAGRPVLVHADRALVGGEAQLRRRAQGVPHDPHRRHRPAGRCGHDVLDGRPRDRPRLVQHRRGRTRLRRTRPSVTPW